MSKGYKGPAGMDQYFTHRERMNMIGRYLTDALDIPGLNERREHNNRMYSQQLGYRPLERVYLNVVDAYRNDDDLGDDPVGWHLDISAVNLVDPGLFERAGFKQKISYLEKDSTRYKIYTDNPDLMDQITSIYEARAFREAVQT